MKHTFFLAPISSGAGLTTVSLGLLRALDKRGLRVGFYKAIGQGAGRDQGPERSTHFVRATSGLTPATPISLQDAEKMVSDGHSDELMNTVMQRFHESAGSADVMVVEGLIATPDDAFVGPLNAELIRTLGAEVLLVSNTVSGPGQSLRDQIDFAVRLYANGDRTRIAGCILNRLPPREGESTKDAISRAKAEYDALPFRPPELVGLIPENETLTQCRTRDIARHLDADVLAAGEIDTRRVKAIHLLARTVPNMMHVFRPGNVLVTPADRDDVFLAACMAALKGIPLAGLVLTGDTPVDGRIFALCSPGIATGLPVLRVSTNSYTTANRLYSMSAEVPSDDLPRIQSAMEFVSDHINAAWIEERCKRDLETRMSPAAFCFQLTERARAANRRIILPEGSEPRTIRAAAICAERGIARCVLLGDPAEIRSVATAQEVTLPPGVEIIDASAVRANYVEPMVELRRHKNLSRQAAADQLEDNVVLGTMMLALGEVDGMVSGAAHSSASTVRPALQLIKTKPGIRSVSSIFFMCLPDQVLVYGDCAVIQDPDAATLAEIAIQSAESARQFGIPPRVAMISYSTGTSGSGAHVEKVREATRIAKEVRPDLLLDGPLQYDAAATADVAGKKAPDSPVAGRATVFVFPDLNTGNTTYKAVQRSANVISIGPMLQGLRRPVNDLSRGALIEDIVYTIALTAVQAAQDS
ncbi:MAG: phosphate acetyltransferase [Terrimicrobiaceae bacterium]|nr:phosphate acetyltransferase [Terrimicrobiaceae bacterium]